jgi:hypothetical protein
VALTLDRPGRPFFMPERKAVMWRAVDVADPMGVVGVGVELDALAALEGRRTLDPTEAARAFEQHLDAIEAAASARFDAAGADTRVIVLAEADLADAIAETRLRRTMDHVARQS